MSLYSGDEHYGDDEYYGDGADLGAGLHWTTCPPEPLDEPCRYCGAPAQVPCEMWGGA